MMHLKGWNSMPAMLKTFDKMPNCIEDMTVNYNVTKHLCDDPELSWLSTSTVLVVSECGARTYTHWMWSNNSPFISPLGSFFSKRHFLTKLLMSNILKIITIKDSNGHISFLKKSLANVQVRFLYTVV